MPYEIDFIGINEETKDADAISFRWKDSKGNFHIGVFDGGFQKHGEALAEHIEKYYFGMGSNRIIDFVVCSHADADHATGLKVILENFKVRALYMNRPWLYIEELYERVKDGRITRESLERRLREKYGIINELEQLAEVREIPVEEAFQGRLIEDVFKILSPSKKMYLDLLAESSKTPDMENKTNPMWEWARERVCNLAERWDFETLRENVETSPENEMSVVLLGEMRENMFLLTGDAGIRGLTAAMDYADKEERDLRNVKFYQVPHHGGRHNVSPSVLNRLIGTKRPPEQPATKTAFVSVGKDSDHPKQMVVNAFIRRGVNVYKTNGHPLCHHYGDMPGRGWGSAEKLKFCEEVEPWND